MGKQDICEFQRNKELRDRLIEKLKVLMSEAGFIPGVPYRTSELKQFLLRIGIPWYVFELTYNVVMSRQLIFDKSIRLPDLLHQTYFLGKRDTSHGIRTLDHDYFETHYKINTRTGLVDVYDMANVTIFYLKKGKKP